MKGKSIIAVVDRIENDKVILITNKGAEIAIASSVLPEAEEGDVIYCLLRLDKVIGHRRKKDVQELLKELGASDED
ncbi:MAG: DUF3006 domain-containing protein [bacterium]|jgi:hypothetical protein|nr:DUF3006 domain-containing protein [bacterium]MDD3805869.1 DUF3006 domain-containing protein [bacterium]MDD4152500.1 DUF3006 domain-containing protein [bacterium]MDD4558228.1 DUF3006 domain-containing protein [bacterium]